jgi:hypothetical protein
MLLKIIAACIIRIGNISDDSGKTEKTSVEKLISVDFKC